MNSNPNSSSGAGNTLGGLLNQQLHQGNNGSGGGNLNSPAQGQGTIFNNVVMALQSVLQQLRNKSGPEPMQAGMDFIGNCYQQANATQPQSQGQLQQNSQVPALQQLQMFQQLQQLMQQQQQQQQSINQHQQQQSVNQHQQQLQQSKSAKRPYEEANSQIKLPSIKQGNIHSESITQDSKYEACREDPVSAVCHEKHSLIESNDKPTNLGVQGTVLVPCRARGMPVDHNFKVHGIMYVLHYLSSN